MQVPYCAAATKPVERALGMLTETGKWMVSHVDSLDTSVAFHRANEAPVSRPTRHESSLGAA